LSLMSGTVGTVPQVFAVLMCPTDSSGKIHDASSVSQQQFSTKKKLRDWQPFISAREGLAANVRLPDQQRHWASRL